jgi:hypothetical protein
MRRSVSCGTIRRTGDADRRALYQATAYPNGIVAAAAYAGRRSSPEQSLLAIATLDRHRKQAKQALRQPRIDNTDSSLQVRDANRGIFDVTGQQPRPDEGMVRPDRPQAIAAGLPSTTAAEARAELSLGEATGHLTAAEGAALRAIIFENDPLRAFDGLCRVQAPAGDLL